MDSVLIVSSAEKSTASFIDLLSQNSYKEVVTVKNCGKAKRLSIERDFDLYIINAPLIDEFGEDFALSVAVKGISQVMLVVPIDLFDEISSKVEDYGVFTISKPISRQIFWNTLKHANASYNKLLMLKRENDKLREKMEDLRLISRAKCTLIQYQNMTEPEAHKYLEKKAMDMRITKKQVAVEVLKALRDNI